MISPKPVWGDERRESADRQQLGKQLHETLRQWYELVENRQLFSTEPFESLEESEREILGKCAARLQQAFTKNHSQVIEKLQKEIIAYRQMSFDISTDLIQRSNGTHREKSEAIQRAVSYLLPIARPLVFPKENPLDEIPFQ